MSQVPMACKFCGKTDGLYETGSIGAWRGVNVMTNGVNITPERGGEYDTDGWHTFERDGYSCSCQDSGHWFKLEDLCEPAYGRDHLGRALDADGVAFGPPMVHPQQMTIQAGEQR